VLDVLDADTLGPGEEGRVRVRRVDGRLDRDAELVGVGDCVVGGVDEDREVVEERPIGRPWRILSKLDVGISDRDAIRSCRPEAVALVLGCGRARIDRAQRDVVQVVVDVGLRLDEHDAQTLARVE